MSKASRNIFLAALVFMVAAFVAGCGGGGSGNSGNGGSGGDEVAVASNIAYRPFEFTQNGEPVGFDIDLMREIGERAGYEVEFQNVQFDGIIGGLGNGLYDAAISAMTITPEREESVDFSKPYFNADQSLLVRSDSEIDSTDDLATSTVGVELGTTGAMTAQELEDGGEIQEVRTFDAIPDAFAALENGQVDAVINDFPVSAYRANTSDGTLEIVQTIPIGEQYGIAFPTDSELIEPVNQALEEIKEDGTYAEIYEKWFGQEPERIPR